MKTIIRPVIEDVPNVFIREQLVNYFMEQSESFSAIEDCFATLTNGVHDREKLNCFFHSWSMTNNSAMTVSGIANRLTLLMHKNKPVKDPMELFQSLISLHRIVDEDLGVVGGVLHKDMYFRMATHFCKTDEWMLTKYITKEATEFKKWKDANSLKDNDIVIGLLTTITHEIYTHGEVEYILPLFRKWMETNEGITGNQANAELAWIIVHTGPTEKNHFYHAINSLEHFVKAMDIDLSKYDMKETIQTYMQRKAATMSSIARVLNSEEAVFA